MCVDANAGIRAQARQEKLKKDALYKQEALKFFNKETTLERTQDANVIGYSRDLSDAYAKAVAEVGQGRKQVEDATRAYLSTIPVDEGGRSRRFGNKNLQLYLSKRAEVDGVIDNILGRNMAYVQEGARRKFLLSQSEAREQLGIPPSYGAPVMLPPTNRLGGALGIASQVIGIASGIKSLQ